MNPDHLFVDPELIITSLNVLMLTGHLDRPNAKTFESIRQLCQLPEKDPEDAARLAIQFDLKADRREMDRLKIYATTLNEPENIIALCESTHSDLLKDYDRQLSTVSTTFARLILETKYHKAAQRFWNVHPVVRDETGKEFDLISGFSSVIAAMFAELRCHPRGDIDAVIVFDASTLWTVFGGNSKKDTLKYKIIPKG